MGVTTWKVMEEDDQMVEVAFEDGLEAEQKAGESKLDRNLTVKADPLWRSSKRLMAKTELLWRIGCRPVM